MKDLAVYLNLLKEEKKYSEHTLKSYKTDIEEFFDFLKKESLDYLDVNYDDLRFYLMDLNKASNKASTVSRKISSLRGFYKYLIKIKKLNHNPFTLVKMPKKEKKVPRFFYYNELELLFKQPDLGTSLGQRNRLILEILYATGIRVSELVNIKLEDLKGDRTIKITAKGNKERYVRYGEYAEVILKQYLEESHNFLNKKELNNLFLNERGGALTDRGVRYILNKIIEDTAVDKSISPHMIRHSFATHLLNEGCDILSVKELLGHESLSATSIYTHLSNDRMKEIYYKAHPRAKKD